MRALTKVAAVPLITLPTGALVMPSAAEFDSTPAEVNLDCKPGRVVGLDYKQWACAIIDVDLPLARVASERARLQLKGYRKAGGQPMVEGWENPEVWVIPRDKYLANRARKLERIQRAVSTGQMMESALSREVVTRA